jgi:LacI family transcriptional regulator
LKVTMKDLAQQLGRSVSVVSRVLNGKADEYRISEKTQKLVKETASERGFSVNLVARGLRLQKTDTIGLLIPDIANSFFALIVRAVENTARRRGYSTILCDSENDENIEQACVSLLENRSIDGLLVAPVAKTTGNILRLHQRNFPVVIIDRFSHDTDIPYVTTNNLQGAYEGTKHLISHGHRHIAFIQGVPNAVPSIERRKGFENALKEHGIAPQEELVRGKEFHEQDGFDSAIHLLNRNPRPTAIFTSSSLGALGAMRACIKLGIKIPDELSIIGFDEHPYAQLLSPPLTTIAQQTQAIGEAASSLLLNWIDTGNRPENASRVFDTQLVPRASVAPPPDVSA